MKIRKIVLIFSVLCFLIFPILVSAHQPRILEGKEVKVVDPEISKAYYSKLGQAGETHVYTIESDKPFDLYVNILLPYSKGYVPVDVKIIKKGNEEKTMAILNKNYEWKYFFEPFGHDEYWQGPEYKSRVEAGKYEILVSSVDSNIKYSLAIGEKEAFDFQEGYNAVRLIPQIKKEIFNKSPIDFILSPFGWGLILVMFLLAFVFGFAYRFLLKKFARNNTRKVHKNIGKKDRILRAALGLFLLVLAITTTWHPILLFVSGFLFFEAIFSWCGFNAMLGKNSCPI